MTERRIVHEYVFGRNALLLKVRLENVVGRPRIDVICAQKRKLLDTQFLKEVVRGRDCLLVRGGTRIEDVLGRFFTLVLDRIEQQTVKFFDHRENRFPRNRGPVAEDYIHFVNCKQFARFFGEQWPVGGWIDHDRLDLATQDAALGVLLLDQHFHCVLKGRLRDRHSPGKRVEHAYLYRTVLSQRRSTGKARRCCESADEFFGSHSEFPSLGQPANNTFAAFADGKRPTI